MVAIQDNIFKAYDIRGDYPGEVNEDVARMVGPAVAGYLKARTVVVGYDGRWSSPSLAGAVKDGLRDCGIKIFDIGETTTPLFYFSVNHLRADGGIMITASHNPGDVNGFKMVDKNAIPISPEDIKALFSQKWERRKGGSVLKEDIEEAYIGRILKKSGIFKTDIEVQICAEDRTFIIAQRILERVGIGISNADGLSFEFDKDGDRIKVDGVRADYLFGLFARDELNKFHVFRPRFIYDPRFSKSVPEYISEHGGETIKSRVGHLFMKKAMRRHKAQIGGELSGHFYFRDMFYVDDPMMAMLKAIAIASRESLARLIKPFQKYYHSGEINIDYKEDRELVLKKLEKEFFDGAMDKTDGLTVEYENWWFSLRLSNTESVLRLVVEADSESLMREMVEKIKKAVFGD